MKWGTRRVRGRKTRNGHSDCNTATTFPYRCRLAEGNISCHPLFIWPSPSPTSIKARMGFGDSSSINTHSIIPINNTMSFFVNTTHLAGPGVQDEAHTKPQPIPTAGHKHPSTPRRVKVTAVVTHRPDHSEVTTYCVEEVDDPIDERAPPTSPPLLSRRRSRSQSSTSIQSDDTRLRTPSPSATASPTCSWSLTPVTPPAHTFMSLLPSPQSSDASFQSLRSLGCRRRVDMGLELDQGWGAYTVDDGYAAKKLGGFQPFTPPALRDEEAHYFLPSDLFSPELEMSEQEFKQSVKSWVERRKERTHKSDTPAGRSE